MSGKKLMLVGLAVVVVLSTLFAVACGGDEGTIVDPKVAMQQALDKVEAKMGALMASIATTNGAQLKAALLDAAPDYQAVVAACEGLEGADAVQAQTLWTALETAVNALSDTAGLADIGVTVAGPGTALQTFLGQLRTLVGPSATATTTVDETTVESAVETTLDDSTDESVEDDTSTTVAP